MAAFLQSNSKFYIKENFTTSLSVGGTFKISGDLEDNSVIDSGGENTFVVLKNESQLERFSLTIAGGIATIVKRGLKKDWVTEDINLWKIWWEGSIGYITPAPPDFIATGKLDTAGGLRNTMGTAQNIWATNGSPNITVADTTGWANGATITGTGIPGGTTIVSFVPNTSAVLSANFTGTTGTVSVVVWKRMTLEIDSSNNEVKKVISNGVSILSTESIRKRKSDGTYEEIEWSNILSLLQSTLWEVSTEYAGETIASQDVLANDYIRAWVNQFLRFWELSSNQKRGFIFTYSWTSWDIKFFVGRSTAFTENFTVKFYTNNSGVPWTLIDTQTVSSANLNPSGTADTTWLVSVTPNLTSRTAGDEIFVEVERSGSLNSTNFFYLGCNNSITDIYFRHYFYNGTVWSAATFNQIPVFWDSVIVNMAIKYNSTVTARNLWLWVASSWWIIWQAISCVKRWLATITGIKNWLAYKTLWNGTLTPVTTTDTVIAIWYAVDKLLIPFTVAKYVPFVNTNISTLVIPVKNWDTVMIYGRHTAGSGWWVVNTTATWPWISLAWAPWFSTYDFNGAWVANADGTLTIQQWSFTWSIVTVNSLVFLKK